MKYPQPDMLVGILNHRNDLSIVKDQLWYRIPVKSAPKMLDKIKFITFYQTNAFGDEKWQVKYFGEIDKISKAKRKKLFPTEPVNSKSSKEYFKIELKELYSLGKPIISRTGRRIVFLPTTFQKFKNAEEINDLFHGSPLEDKLWDEMIRNNINAERQYAVYDGAKTYFLDFAIFCKKYKLDVECGGFQYHSSKESLKKDYERNNFLTKDRWKILNFSKDQLKEPENCIYEIQDVIEQSGGMGEEAADEEF
jgi:very-short-patch-repair endonuclease